MYTIDYVGGGMIDKFTYDEMCDCLICDNESVPASVGMIYQFSNYTLKSGLSKLVLENNSFIRCNIPLKILINRLQVSNLKLVAAVHGIYIKPRTPHQLVLPKFGSGPVRAVFAEPELNQLGSA